MRLLWILGAGLLVQACSVSRERHAEHHHASEAGIKGNYRDSLLRKDTLAEWYARQFHTGCELLTIAPVGDFTYHPDSGFSGRAEKLVVYREQTGETTTRQRRQEEEIQRATRQQTDISKAESGSTVESRESQTDFRFPWWWAVGVLVLGGIVFRYFRKILKGLF